MSAVNPAVAHAKFEREVSRFLSDAARFRGRGAFILEAQFPTVLVGFAAPQLAPPAMVMAVLFDYVDFDLQPPSVRFVNPFTSVPYTAEALPSAMLQTVETPFPPGFPIPGMAGIPGVPGPIAANSTDVDAPAQSDDAPESEQPAEQPMMVARQPLIQAHESGGLPFLCVPGVREFHEHPGHTGQPWELERPNGAGGLVRLVELILKYGIEPIGGWAVNLVPQVSLGLGEPPK